MSEWIYIDDGWFHKNGVDFHAEIIAEKLNVAEARIAKLESEVAELKPYRDGYDASKDFPEDGERVFAYISNGNGLFPAYYRNGNWYNFFGEQVLGIKHWWKLPEVKK